MMDGIAHEHNKLCDQLSQCHEQLGVGFAHHLTESVFYRDSDSI